MRGLAVRRFGFVALLTGAVALSLVFLPSRAGAADGTVQIGSNGAGIGQDAGVTLSALDVGAPGVGAWTIDVAYDAASLAVVTCQAKQGGICNASFGQGVLRVTGISAGGLVGDSDLAQVTFRCNSIGAGELAIAINVFSDATPGAPQPINAVVQSGAISCTEDPSTPTTMPTESPEPTAPPPGSEPDKLAGDADCDGDVDAIDAAFVLQFEAGLVDALACPNNADANHDGVAGPVDAALILQTSAGLLG